MVFIVGVNLVACDQAKVGTSNASPTSEKTTADSSTLKSTKPEADCAKAITIINTCAHEDACDESITTYLPSEPRNHFNSLSQKSWFNADAFTKYCINACLAKNAKVDAEAFQLEVCGYAEN